jgi:sulfatase maturation enzyme AslB (radical SAM superfamily)
VQVFRSVAADHQLPLRLACTTNGVLDAGTTEWLAATFDSVTVSLDGLPEIHDRQRPLAAGGGSSSRVERTLTRLLQASPRPEEIAIRATITDRNVGQQVEMVRHFLYHFPVDRLLFQPLYGRRNQRHYTSAPDAEQFIRHFIRARRLARSAGIDLVLAGSRVGEQHGRFCPILQHNLTLTPGGHASACFLALDDSSASDQPFFYGSYDPASDRFLIDEARFRQLLSQLTRPRAHCLDCFNLRHCAQGCPYTCPLAAPAGGRSHGNRPDAFEGTTSDCHTLRAVAFASLLEAAGIELDDHALADLSHQLPPLATGVEVA